MIGNSDDNTNFPRELLLTNRKVANLHKAFANHTSADCIQDDTVRRNSW